MNDTQQRMKEIIAEKRQQKLPPEGKAAVTSPKPQPEMIKHRCGHLVGVAHYSGIDCGACRQAGKRKKAEARRAKLVTKAPNEKKLLDTDGRLPDRARFVTVYDAIAQTWNVTLEIVGVNTFTASGSSLEKTLRVVANMCRGVGA